MKDDLTIWKFPIEFGARPLPMPRGAKLLSVAAQFDKPHVWALVNPQNEVVPRYVFSVGTGMACVPGIADATFVGTFQLRGGALVFHVFDFGETLPEGL